MVRMLLVLLLLGGCASRDGWVESEIRKCDAGGELSIDAYLNMPKVMMERANDELTMTILIGNNSERDIEIKSIRMEPGRTAQQRYALQNSFREFNETLKPGEDKQFELPVRGSAGEREIRRPIDDFIEVVLSVYLADGTTYRCEYAIQAPR